MPAGRPSKYDPKFCDIAINLLKQGASISEVCAELDISRTTLYEWVNPESQYYIKEFSNTLKSGLEFSRAWWEKQGRIGLRDRKFNPTTWFMNVKNRFGKKPETANQAIQWGDKHEQDVTGVVEIKGEIIEDNPLENE